LSSISRGSRASLVTKALAARVDKFEITMGIRDFANDDIGAFRTHIRVVTTGQHHGWDGYAETLDHLKAQIHG
jgi:hypothetical protein